MNNRFREWLYGKFLPAHAKETVWRENMRLKKYIERLEVQRETDTAKAYAEGMAYALRHMKVSIRNEVK